VQWIALWQIILAGLEAGDVGFLVGKRGSSRLKRKLFAGDGNGDNIKIFMFQHILLVESPLTRFVSVV